MALAEVLTALEQALGPGSVITDPAELAPHLTDWRASKTGRADALLKPRDTAQVQAIVRIAAAHGAAIVPQGGNTGLVGGSVPEPGGERTTLILSTRRLDQIHHVDASGLSLVAGAGAILSNVHAAADASGVRFPLSLGAKGSATIGGLVSTNAGGTQVLRHGTMRNLVLGLRAVLPDGSVLDQLGPLRKDNTGYDVKQLLIGAEGTLGVVTEVALRLAPALSDRAVAWAGVASASDALALLGLLRARLGERIESFELLDADALAMVLAFVPGTRAPLEGAHAFQILIEAEAPDAQLEGLLAEAIGAGIVMDATVAQSEAQAAALWRLREDVPMGEKLEGPSLKNDVSIPVAMVPTFLDAVRVAFANGFGGARPLAFGHLGDGNLHLNLRPPHGVDGREWLATRGEEARRLLHDLIAAHHGSISAEHGIGTLKAAEFARLADPGKLAAVKAVKRALDPDDIMNPAKILAYVGGAR